eukprot:Gb_37415 [translate_table: standard]
MGRRAIVANRTRPAIHQTQEEEAGPSGIRTPNSPFKQQQNHSRAGGLARAWKNRAREIQFGNSGNNINNACIDENAGYVSVGGRSDVEILNTARRPQMRSVTIATRGQATPRKKRSRPFQGKPKTSTECPHENVNGFTIPRASIEVDEPLLNQAGPASLGNGVLETIGNMDGRYIGSGCFQIEAVRKKRMRKGNLEFLVKWLGWPESANTWEPFCNVQQCTNILEDFERSRNFGPQGKQKQISQACNGRRKFCATSESNHVQTCAPNLTTEKDSTHYLNNLDQDMNSLDINDGTNLDSDLGNLGQPSGEKLFENRDLTFAENLPIMRAAPQANLDQLPEESSPIPAFFFLDQASNHVNITNPFHAQTLNGRKVYEDVDVSLPSSPLNVCVENREDDISTVMGCCHFLTPPVPNELVWKLESKRDHQSKDSRDSVLGPLNQEMVNPICDLPVDKNNLHRDIAFREEFAKGEVQSVLLQSSVEVRDSSVGSSTTRNEFCNIRNIVLEDDKEAQKTSEQNRISHIAEKNKQDDMEQLLPGVKNMNGNTLKVVLEIIEEKASEQNSTRGLHLAISKQEMTNSVCKFKDDLGNMKKDLVLKECCSASVVKDGLQKHQIVSLGQQSKSEVQDSSLCSMIVGNQNLSTIQTHKSDVGCPFCQCTYLGASSSKKSVHEHTPQEVNKFVGMCRLAGARKRKRILIDVRTEWACPNDALHDICFSFLTAWMDKKLWLTTGLCRQATLICFLTSMNRIFGDSANLIPYGRTLRF